jgi:hypothetical protein
MVTIDFVLHVLALVCFLAEVSKSPRVNLNLVALGLALLTLSLLI